MYYVAREGVKGVWDSFGVLLFLAIRVSSIFLHFCCLAEKQFYFGVQKVNMAVELFKTSSKIVQHCDSCCVILQNCTNCVLKESCIENFEVALFETPNISPPQSPSNHDQIISLPNRNTENTFAKPNFACHYCAKTFCSKFSMERHEYQLHQKVRDVEKPKPFKCACGKEYSTKENLKRDHP